MSAPQQASIRNQLLAAMPQEDFAALQPHLESVDLPLRKVLIEPHQPIAHVYFPDSGYSSIRLLAQCIALPVSITVVTRMGIDAAL